MLTTLHDSATAQVDSGFPHAPRRFTRCLLSRRSQVRILPGVPKLGRTCRRLSRRPATDVALPRKTEPAGLLFVRISSRVAPLESSQLVARFDSFPGSTVLRRLTPARGLTSPLPFDVPSSREPYGGFLTLDDDEVVKISGLDISSSGVSSSPDHPDQNEDATLIAYITARWSFRGAEWLVSKYGSDHLWQVVAHLDLLQLEGKLPRIRNRAGYFRACVDDASSANPSRNSHVNPAKPAAYISAWAGPRREGVV
jgi:hypothetical protein